MIRQALVMSSVNKKKKKMKMKKKKTKKKKKKMGFRVLEGNRMDALIRSA